MKAFFKILLASMVGSMVALAFLFFMGLGILSGLSGLAEMETDGVESGSVESPSVLRLDFDGPVKDHLEKQDLWTSLLSYSEPPVTGLFEVSQALKKAAKDPRIKGLFLHFTSFQSSLAMGEALRRLITEFKTSGKFVVSYAESYSELDFLVASAADEVVLYPKGYFEWDGFYSKITYFKKALGKLQVEPQIFRVGRYKSAVEPYTNEKMSEASREQLEALLEGSWTQLLQYGAEKTKLSREELNALASEARVLYAKQALEKGFVSLLSSFEDVEERLKELSGAKEKVPYVSWRSYYKQAVKPEQQRGKGQVIALVFAEGEVHTKASERRGISSEELTKLFTKIRREEEVKAVVLRVNSPGGSALASDVIWTANQWLKDKKPVVASFGSMAASGGYYLSVGSQYILAEATTITGSIGVFGADFATKAFWNDKVGVTFDTAKTHRFADIQGLVRPFNSEERMKVQGMVNHVYQNFLEAVTLGRPGLKSSEQTHQLAQGRVWLGLEAKAKGLVDDIGGMDQAIKKAAELAELETYRVEVFPKELSAFQAFMKPFSGVSMWSFRALLPEPLRVLFPKIFGAKTSRDFMESPFGDKALHERVYTRLPFNIEVL